MLSSTSLVSLMDPFSYTLIQAVSNESRNSPFILFMKEAEKSIVGNSESYTTFKSRLEKLPDNTVIIGSHTQADNRKEKVLILYLRQVACCGEVHLLAYKRKVFTLIYIGKGEYFTCMRVELKSR